MLSSAQCGGVRWLAHTLEIQLRIREARVLTVDAQRLLSPPGGAAHRLSLADQAAVLQASMKRLFSAGTVRVDGEVLELDSGGFVLLHGEDLHTIDLFSHGSELASTDHFFVQARAHESCMQPHARFARRHTPASHAATHVYTGKWAVRANESTAPRT